jgi:hypothetical protein
MNQINNEDNKINDNNELIGLKATISAEENSRQIALRKINRRYAAYIIPSALAVLSNATHAIPNSPV